MMVDPNNVDLDVYELAASFVGDLLRELSQGQRAGVDVLALTFRAAQAMQRAIEDELTAIRQELTT